MNEKYTYGYGLGWNVENAYINDSKDIMNEYNNQVKVIDDIQSYHGRLQQSMANEITEEQIRQWYNEDYASNGSLKSYESYNSNSFFLLYIDFLVSFFISII